MNIVLVGNAKTNGDQMKEISEKLTGAGLGVRYPSEHSDMIKAFENIDWADYVIAVPREGLTFDHSTDSEISYAKYRKKAVFIYYD